MAVTNFRVLKFDLSVQRLASSPDEIVINSRIVHFHVVPASVNVRFDQISNPSQTIDRAGTIESCDESFGTLYLDHAAGLTGTLEIWISQGVESSFESVRSTAVALQTFATVSPGAQGTGNLFDSHGQNLNDGTTIAVAGGGTAAIDNDEATLHVDGLKTQAILVAGASIQKQVHFTHLSLPLRAIFDSLGAPRSAGYKKYLGEWRLRDRVLHDVDRKAGTNNSNAFFGYGGIGNTIFWGIGFEVRYDKGGSPNWWAFARSNDAVLAQQVFVQDLGLDARVVRDLELRVGVDVNGPYAEWWVDGVKLASLLPVAGVTWAGAQFGASIACASYAIMTGSVNAGDNSRSTLWSLLHGALMFSYRSVT